MNAHVHPAHLIPATEGRKSDLGWALIKATSSATHYSKVKILRTGKRFTYVQTGAGNEWRVTTRGLWTFQTEAAADAELDTLAQIWRDHMPVRRSRPTIRETMARFLGEADAAQYRPSGNRPSLTALAEHDREQRVFRAITEAAETVAAKRNCAPRPAPSFKLTIYGLERI